MGNYDGMSFQYIKMLFCLQIATFITFLLSFLVFLNFILHHLWIFIICKFFLFTTRIIFMLIMIYGLKQFKGKVGNFIYAIF
jgi:hypothetical protein